MIEPDLLRERLTVSQDEDKPDDLSPVTNIEIDVVGSRGKRYAGSFTFKVPTLGEQVTIGQMKAVYLPQGSPADQNAMLLVEQICYLEVTLDKKRRPDWYKPMVMYDAAPIGELYRRALDYERRFHGADKVSGGDQKVASGEAGSDGEREAPVGRKVQPPAERRETLVAVDKGGD